MKIITKNIGTIKYHEYIIEGHGNYYTLYHPDGCIGNFNTCKEAKQFVDKERKELDNMWNDAILTELDDMGYSF